MDLSTHYIDQPMFRTRRRDASGPHVTIYNTGHEDENLWADHSRGPSANASNNSIDNQHVELGVHDAVGTYAHEIRRIFESQGAYWTSESKQWTRSTRSRWTLVQAITVTIYKTASDFRAWIRLYGLFGGLAVGFGGKKSVWEVLVRVLGSPDPPPALQLKKIVEDESGRIGVTVRTFSDFLSQMGGQRKGGKSYGPG